MVKIACTEETPTRIRGRDTHILKPTAVVQVVAWRRQRTLAKAIAITGRGLFYGRQVRLRLLPAEAGYGRVFVRTDGAASQEVPATTDSVTDTRRRTVLGNPPGQIEVVEHVLAALAGMMVDNCRIELDGPEPPGWDGSVQELVTALCEAGTCVQDADIPIFAPCQPFDLRHNGSRIVFLPSAGTCLEVNYFLDYGWWAAIPPQRFGCRVNPQDLVNDLAASRTFLLIEEVQALRRQGIGTRTGPEQVLVFGKQGVLANRLRWADEPARHKTLDLIGDLSLVGYPLVGRLVAYRSGHTLNVHLAQQLRTACRSIELTSNPGLLARTA